MFGINTQVPWILEPTQKTQVYWCEWRSHSAKKLLYLRSTMGIHPHVCLLPLKAPHAGKQWDPCIFIHLLHFCSLVLVLKSVSRTKASQIKFHELLKSGIFPQITQEDTCPFNLCVQCRDPSIRKPPLPSAPVTSFIFILNFNRHVDLHEDNMCFLYYKLKLVVWICKWAIILW